MLYVASTVGLYPTTSTLSTHTHCRMLENLNVEAKKAVDVADIDSKEELKKEVMRLRALFSGAQ